MLGLAVVVVAVSGAYLWLDQPIALYVHDHAVSGHNGLFVGLTHIPDPLMPIAVVVLLGVGFRAMAGFPLSKHYAAALVCSLSYLMAEATKDQLKFLFGRTWPETWTHDNPSFIRDGVYGFNFLHEGVAYQSFPSGHTAATFSVISALWVLYPRWRILYGLAALAVCLGLIGANYHFLSDVIAGGFVGITTGMLALAMRRALAA